MSRRALACAVIVLLALPVFAWNPLSLSGGSPRKWDTAGAVVWNPDGGGLGKLGNAAATTMVSDEFAKWQAVTTAVITYSQGGQIIDPNTALPTDVTSANYNDVINEDNGQNPIIYDNDRDIFDMLGTPSGVVGFAGFLRASGTTITKGYAVLQGDWFDDEPQGTAPSDPGEISEAGFRGMMVHEFGHFNGLAHTSVNHEVAALPGCPAPTDANIETMSPSLTSDALTLHEDEIVGISELYPTAAFTNNFARIRGGLFARDGTPLAAGNVILRPDTLDCDTLYNKAQAAQPGSNPNEAGGSSGYRFAGLDPSTGYTLEATTINDGGSYPIAGGPLNGPDDGWDNNEDWFNPPDVPTVQDVVTTGAAGSSTDGIDIRINNAGSPGRVLSTLTLDKLSGFQDPETKQLDDGGVNSASGWGGTAQGAWINRFTPAAGELPLRIEEIHVLTWHGSIQVGRPIRLLIYTDPAATGNPANATLSYSEDVTIQVVSTTTFNEYTLTTPFTVTGGEYYVGAFDLDPDAQDTFIESSDTDTPSGRSYHQANSTAPAGYGLVGDRTWMVRAVGSTEVPAGSVRLDWAGACNEGTVPDQDFAVYEGSIGSLAGGGDHAAIACSTGKALTYDVLGAGADRFWLTGPVLANREGSLGTGSGGASRDPAVSCETINPEACP